jgi:MYXO-CTERM domain-containing protein
VFDRVEQMGAPRLVEYWEQDPCAQPTDDDKMARVSSVTQAVAASGGMATGSFGVTIEAKFTVGEYQIAILSARDSTGLNSWLVHEKYRIPAGAEPLLRPYVESGSKFFVAKVDPAKVAFGSDGRAALSPLRFHYDSDEFALPIRLGMANSSGTQDLIVNILAPHQRYEVANYKNVTIPTNIDVRDTIKDRFPAFYAALFDRTIEQNPGAVVTEYAWQASTCDPCPGPTLNQGDFATLGADAIGDAKDRRTAPPAAMMGYDLVLTRLHARYGKTISQDLVFRAAEPIVGGREMMQSGEGGLEDGARPARQNNFQGRYAIRHPWTGPIRCARPARKVWGGPPPEIAQQPGFTPTGIRPAIGLAFAPRGQVELTQVVQRDIPELRITAGKPTEAAPPPASGPGSAAPSKPGSAAPAVPPIDRSAAAPRSGCGCASSDPRGGLGGALLLVAGLIATRRRRRGKGQRARTWKVARGDARGREWPGSSRQRDGRNSLK